MFFARTRDEKTLELKDISQTCNEEFLNYLSTIGITQEVFKKIKKMAREEREERDGILMILALVKNRSISESFIRSIRIEYFYNKEVMLEIAKNPQTSSDILNDILLNCKFEEVVGYVLNCRTSEINIRYARFFDI